MQLVGILHVHHLVADIVGSLHNVDERMAAIASAAVRCWEDYKTELVGDTAECRYFGREES